MVPAGSGIDVGVDGGAGRGVTAGKCGLATASAASTAIRNRTPKLPRRFIVALSSCKEMLKHPSPCNTGIDDNECRATAENRDMPLLRGGYQMRVRSW